MQEIAAAGLASLRCGCGKANKIAFVKSLGGDPIKEDERHGKNRCTRAAYKRGSLRIDAWSGGACRRIKGTYLSGSEEEAVRGNRSQGFRGVRSMGEGGSKSLSQLGQELAKQFLRLWRGGGSRSGGLLVNFCD